MPVGTDCSSISSGGVSGTTPGGNPGAGGGNTGFFTSCLGTGIALAPLPSSLTL